MKTAYVETFIFHSDISRSLNYVKIKKSTNNWATTKYNIPKETSWKWLVKVSFLWNVSWNYSHKKSEETLKLTPEDGVSMKNIEYYWAVIYR